MAAATHHLMALRLSRKPCLKTTALVRCLSSLPPSPPSPPSPPFPWRHSAVPLQRVIDHQDLSGVPSSGQARFIRSLQAARLLKVPWVDIFLTHSWKDALAQDLTWAFQKGVAGVVSHIFQIPIQDIDKEDDGIVVDTTTAPHERCWTDEQKSESLRFLSTILEEKLLNIYKDIDTMSLQLIFQLKPIQFRLEHAFLISLLSRSLAKKTPSLKQDYVNIRLEFHNSGDFSKVREMESKLAQNIGSQGSRSVIVDVSVDCLELFQLKDASTGQLLQGTENPDPQMVTHLVRFEFVTSVLDDHDPDQSLDSWTIIDWDDLLDGNVWHV